MPHAEKRLMLNYRDRFTTAIRGLARFMARAVSVGVPDRNGRRAFRTEAFLKIDQCLYLAGHLRAKNKLLAEAPGAWILVVTQELSLTGAPLALLAAVKALLKRGDISVFLISFSDGPLRAQFETLGVTTMVGSFYKSSPLAIKQISDGFDLMLANTIVCAGVVNEAALPPDRVMWWLHESKGIAALAEEAPEIYKKALLTARNIYVVSEHARSFAEKYRPVEVCHLGIEDIFEATSDRINAETRLRLAVVGAFYPLKNQQLVLEALDLMPPDCLEQLEILFIGKPHNDYYQSVVAAAKPRWPVVFIGEVSDPVEKKRLFSSIDVFCVPSRDESCSLVVLEAFMLAKPVIISDQVGAKYLLEDGKNGLIFPSEDAEALMKAMQWMIANRPRLEAMGRQARQVYLEKASCRQFEERLLKIINDLLPDKK